MSVLFLALFLMQTEPTESPPPSSDEIERLEQEQREAQTQAETAEQAANALAREIADLQQQLVDAARQVDASERVASVAESRIDDLTDRESEILDRIHADRENLIDVLAALQRIERGTPPAMAVAPGDAVEAARAAGLFADIAPALRDRANALAAELDALRSVREDTVTETDNLARVESSLETQRNGIERLIAERERLEQLRRSEAARFSLAARAAGEEADSLRGLMIRLRAMSSVTPRLNPRQVDRDDDIPMPTLRPNQTLMAALAPTEPLETLRFSDARGRLRPPVSGRVSRRFGDDDINGEPSDGVLIRARSRAQVTAPFDGQVEFAGPFGAYHGLLILNVGDEYYIVIAGLAAVYAEAGRTVLAGEPIGAMPEQDDPAPDLYLELQRSGQAIDPEPWLRPDARAR